MHILHHAYFRLFSLLSSQQSNKYRWRLASERRKLPTVVVVHMHVLYHACFRQPFCIIVRWARLLRPDDNTFSSYRVIKKRASLSACMHALSWANKVLELDVINHGAELSYVGAMSASRCQRSTHLDVKICDVEQCYLGVTACDTEEKVQK